LARVVTGDRTGDLLIINPTPYPLRHYATRRHRAETAARKNQEEGSVKIFKENAVHGTVRYGKVR